MQLDVEESTPASSGAHYMNTNTRSCPPIVPEITFDVKTEVGSFPTVYFHIANCHILQDMNYFLVLGFGLVTTDRRTESDA